MQQFIGMACLQLVSVSVLGQQVSVLEICHSDMHELTFQISMDMSASCVGASPSHEQCSDGAAPNNNDPVCSG